VRRLLPTTLRSRLIAGLLALLAAACLTLGFATNVALRQFLVSRVDQQLNDTGERYALSLEHPGLGDETQPGDTRAQANGTFGARMKNGVVTQTGVVDGDADDLGSGDTDDQVTLSTADHRALAALPGDGSHHTVRLSSLGTYRLAKVSGRDGDQLVGGLPLTGVEDTVHRLMAIEAVVFAAVLVVTGIAGALWVRLSLRPLRRVAATASRVTELPLASGEVALPERVPYTDPRTEVGQVGTALNRMLGHVEDALARRQAGEQRLRRFAADAGHELRTPLAAIRGHAELARRRREGLDPEVAHALDRIRAESLRMGVIVDDLLLLARLDAGRPLEREPVDLTVLAIDAASDARAAGPGHRWTLELPEEPVTVTGDRNRLHQLLGNLLSNARTHTPPGTTVTVALAADGADVRLTVADDGPGIPEPLLGEVFDRFVRGGEGRARADGGTGLGLAIAHAVATAHGGSLTVDSRPGRTAFTLRLPAAAGSPSDQPKKTSNSA
jgi:two-component system OmpR family sensor kinase